jgi:hypothetical protein
MAAKKHQDRKHALLSASGAFRWLNCTPSARIEEQFSDSETSYAAEGTLAHELGELYLERYAGFVGDEEYLTRFKQIENNDLFSDEMPEEVQKYTNYVIEQFEVAKKKTEGAVLLIEEVVDLTHFIEDGFGTCDSNIIADGTLEVIDQKYGKGVKVSAIDNDQLKLYGLGALYRYELSYDIHTVKLTIVQPRLDHISSTEIPVEELLKYGEHTIKPKAELAYEGKGIQQAGTWCRWCKAKAKCATLASVNLKITKHDFADPHLLTDEQLISVYAQMPQITDWIKAVSDHLLTEALNGKHWPGHKLVEGKSIRKWSDEEKVREELARRYEEAEYLNTKLKGLGDIEKLVGKAAFPKILGPFVVKPQGKPTLVHESDKRPALGADQAKEDFK